MTPVSIVGGGVVGLVLGLRLVRAGHPTSIIDPAPLGENASGVAAGMLAPASESLESDVRGFERLLRARDLWLDLAANLGVVLDRSGTIHVSAECDRSSIGTALDAIGAQSMPAAETVWPDGSQPLAGTWTPQDWHLEPQAVLASLHSAFLTAGGAWVSRSIASSSDLLSLQVHSTVVLATGWGGAAFAAFAPELRHLSPIKGQIMRFASSSRRGPVLRHRGTYVAGCRDGLTVGATMEVGFSDLRLDPEKLDRLQAAAAEIVPEIAGAERMAAAGVRAATPDGWPLVGRSSTGLWLSVGARRNGWLLAPLMAEVLHARFEGRPHVDASTFTPDRFDIR